MKKRILAILICIMLILSLMVSAFAEGGDGGNEGSSSGGSSAEQSEIGGTDTPTSKPTDKPSSEQTDAPTSKPTDTHTSEPTDAPSSEPTDTPTSKPTDEPTSAPTSTLSPLPTSTSTVAPTQEAVCDHVVRCADKSTCIKCGTKNVVGATVLHGATRTHGEKKATCTLNGYTGNEVCADCGHVFSRGSTIRALGHSYNKDGICIRCGAKQKTAETTTETTEESTQEEYRVIELGTSGLCMTVDASCVAGEVTDQDAEKGQIAQYYSNAYAIELGVSGIGMMLDRSYETLQKVEEANAAGKIASYWSEKTKVYFEIYQHNKVEGETLSDVAAQLAGDGLTCEEIELNGIPAIRFDTTSEKDGVRYLLRGYVMASDSVFVETDFYFESEESGSAVEEIISTFIRTKEKTTYAPVDAPADAPVDGIVDLPVAETFAGTPEGNANVQVIELGTSGLHITLDASYTAGEIGEAGISQGQVGYYSSELYPVDFNVYQWAKSEGETLSSIAANISESDIEYVMTELNGVPAFYCDAMYNIEGTQVPVRIYFMETDEAFVEIDFQHSGGYSEAIIGYIISTVSK